MKKNANVFGIKKIAVRFFYAALLVLLTYNPYGWSMVDWLKHDVSPYSLGVSLIMLVIWFIVGWLVLVAIGVRGALLIAVVISTLIWMAYYGDWLALDDMNTNVLLVEIMLAAILALGLSWAHIRRRLTGQIATDEVGDID